MNIEIFFDYSCPYCYKGHKNLLELHDKYKDIDIIWRPCEAHPRPENYSIHSDLAIQGMMYIQNYGGDVRAYHQEIFEAVFKHHLNIENIDVLAGCAAKCGVNTEGFKKSLEDGVYAKDVLANNKYAWSDKKLQAVPSYISGSKFIGSQNGQLVTKEELDDFLSDLS